MPYPPPPWTLKGAASLTLHLVDIQRVRPFVPQELHIVPILPGKTLGVVYLANYGPGSVLTYNELIVAPALARYRRSFGFWISHIYVDDPDSMAGGREIWGLPKEMAQFTWDEGPRRQVVVRQGEQCLCTLRYGADRRLWRQPIVVPAHSLLQGDLLWFKGIVRARLGLGRGRLDVPPESPFAALGLGRGRLAYHLRDMHFVAHGPKVIGRSAARREAEAADRGGIGAGMQRCKEGDAGARLT